MRTPEEALDDIFNGFSSQTLVEKPCVVSRVIDNYTVDITYYDNNEPNTLVNVPVKHLQTNTAFIFLALKVGDCGTVRFFDNDVTAYYNGSDVASDEDRMHDLNDNCYTYGFYPSVKHYVFPESDIAIGTVDGGLITISGSNVTISGGKTVIDGVNFLNHTHSNGNQGNPTGAVIIQ